MTDKLVLTSCPQSGSKPKTATQGNKEGEVHHFVKDTLGEVVVCAVESFSWRIISEYVRWRDGLGLKLSFLFVV